MRIVLISLLSAFTAAAAGVPYFTQPTLCPTRPEIAFVSGGDIWVVAAKGGEAHLLVSHPADDSRPLYSPDGNRLAFMSKRTGGGDIYVLTLSNGSLTRLTFDDGEEQLDAWSRDGKWIYFSTGAHDVGGKNDLYRVSSEGGTPMPVSADRYTNEFQGAPGPDGSSLAFAARGNERFAVVEARTLASGRIRNLDSKGRLARIVWARGGFERAQRVAHVDAGRQADLFHESIAPGRRISAGRCR